MRPFLSSFLRFATFGVILLSVVPLNAQITQDRSLVPASIRDPILLEYSGELAYAHVQLLALNRQRSVEEYADTYMETTYMEEMATRYGLSEVRVDYFPTGDPPAPVRWIPPSPSLKCQLFSVRFRSGQGSRLRVKDAEDLIRTRTTRSASARPGSSDLSPLCVAWGQLVLPSLAVACVVI